MQRPVTLKSLKPPFILLVLSRETWQWRVCGYNCLFLALVPFANHQTFAETACQITKL